jgi:hypothetical protein
MRKVGMTLFAVVALAGACQGPLDEPVSEVEQAGWYLPWDPTIFDPPPAPACELLPPAIAYADWIAAPYPLYASSERAATLVYTSADDPAFVVAFGVEVDADKVTWAMHVPAAELPVFLAALEGVNNTVDPVTGRALVRSHIASTPGTGGKTPTPRPGGDPADPLRERAKRMFEALEAPVDVFCTMP